MMWRHEYSSAPVLGVANECHMKNSGRSDVTSTANAQRSVWSHFLDTSTYQYGPRSLVHFQNVESFIINETREYIKYTWT